MCARHGPFKLLGSAVNSADWCENLLLRRDQKAWSLIFSIDKYDDAQGFFALLRSCSGLTNILYSCSTVSTSLQTKSLFSADCELRMALVRLIGAHLDDYHWSFRQE